mgnify:CR=1 FL=1
MKWMKDLSETRNIKRDPLKRVKCIRETTMNLAIPRVNSKAKIPADL